MCSDKILEFGARALTSALVAGKRVVEVGSRIVQDPSLTLRHHVVALQPKSYLGIDMLPGNGVDEVCSALDLIDRYGEGSFDVVLSTEMLEHIEDWQAAIRNLKQLVAPGGVLLLTTRSEGFPYHAWPHDYWRFSLEDMRALFGDLEILLLEPDPKEPGVFLLARKGPNFVEHTPERELYSMINGRRVLHTSRIRWYAKNGILGARRAWQRAVPEPARMFLNRLLGRKHTRTG